MEQVLYQLPDGWEWRSIKQLSHNIQYGHTAKAESNGNAKFLRITDIQNGNIDWPSVPTVSLTEKDIRKYALNDNDLVFARTGATSGKSILIKDAPLDAIFASYLIRIVPDQEQVIPEYLGYFFLTPAYWEIVGLNAAGAAQPNINGTKLSEFIVPVAPQSEQKNIVEKLDALLNRIDTAIEHLQESVALADSLFESSQSEIFNDVLSNYQHVTIDEICTVTSSKRIFKADYVESGIPFYRTKEIVDLSKEQDISTELFIDKQKYSEISDKFGVPKKGDLLFSAVGTIGVMWIVDEREFYFKDGNLLWLKDMNGVIPEYLKSAISAVLTEKIKDRSQGAAYKAISITNLKAFEIPLPSIEEQKSIVTKVEHVSSLTRKAKQEVGLQIKYLQKLKASILDSAFKGEL